MWTTPDDIKNYVEKMWNRGALLKAMITGRSPYPVVVRLKGPRSGELASRFDEVRAWVDALKKASKDARGKGYRIEYRQAQSRELGRNLVPESAVVDSAEDALYLIRRAGDAARFAGMLATAEEMCPTLVSYLERRHVRAIPLSDVWEAVARTALWVSRNPMPGIYARQVDLPGVDTKFFEKNESAIADLIDALDVIPSQPLANEDRAKSDFEARYGFLSEQPQLRFRPPEGNGVFPDCVTDITLPADEFARLSFPKNAVKRVFVTENKVNFLSFPSIPNAMVIWGKGYGCDLIGDAKWLEDALIFYWGDIDTNGFAILDRFRSHFPEAKSFLMDRDTLLSHKKSWVREDTQRRAALTRLDDSEADLYSALLEDRFGEHVRLEQERISYSLVLKAVAEINLV